MSLGFIILLLLIVISFVLVYVASLLSTVSMQYLEVKTYLDSQVDTVTPRLVEQQQVLEVTSNRVLALDKHFEELGDVLVQILNQIKLLRESNQLIDTRLSELSPSVINILSIVKSFQGD